MNHKGLIFDGRLKHYNDDFEGTRVSLVAFTHVIAHELDGQERRQLARLGFPLEFWDPRSVVRMKLTLFLEAYSGAHAPLTRAVLRKGRACIAPTDYDVKQMGVWGDLLQEDNFNFLMRLAWTGCIGAIHMAPPCSSYSTLRSRPGGPKPVRSDKQMEGLPSNNTRQWAEYNTSKTLHQRCPPLMQAVMAMGGFASYEQPPSSLAWHE